MQVESVTCIILFHSLISLIISLSTAHFRILSLITSIQLSISFYYYFSKIFGYIGNISFSINSNNFNVFSFIFLAMLLLFNFILALFTFNLFFLQYFQYSSFSFNTPVFKSKNISSVMCYTLRCFIL